MRTIVCLIALYLCNCSFIWNNPDIRAYRKEDKCNSSPAPYVLDIAGLAATSTLSGFSAAGAVRTEINPQAITTVLAMVAVAYGVSLIAGSVENGKCIESHP